VVRAAGISCRRGALADRPASHTVGCAGARRAGIGAVSGGRALAWDEAGRGWDGIDAIGVTTSGAGRRAAGGRVRGQGLRLRPPQAVIPVNISRPHLRNGSSVPTTSPRRPEMPLL